MSTKLLKYKIDGFYVPQFQLDYIFGTTKTSHKNAVKLCRDVHYMWWVNQELELQKWEDCINYKRTRILDIILLVSNKNLIGYKEHSIYFILFFFVEGVKISY